jgi:hypothetical protein
VRVGRAPGLTSVRETGTGLGDMMIDGVVPPGCGRAGLSRLSARGDPLGGSKRNGGRRPRRMATVHRLLKGRRFHPHRRHGPAGTGA